ncbi:MAG: methyltransferase domain-containing protein [Polyangiaceae bacterium]
MKKVLVFTATYNEADNVASLVADIFTALPQCDLLIVDDNSPDGTGRILDDLKRTNPRLFVIHRPSKNGLGSAHKLAIKYALAHGYQSLITMDADFSHDPKYLPDMVRELESAAFVIGSRYAPGGSCGYSLSRLMLSRTANTLTRMLLGIPLHETTTSYRGFRRSLLEKMDVDSIHADGYSYFVESLFQVSRIVKPNGVTPMAELPIRFVDRRAGTTKISRKEIWKGFTTLGRLAAGRAAEATGLKSRAHATERADDLVACNACGCPYHVEVYPAASKGQTSVSYSCTSTAHASHGRIVQCLGCGLVFTCPQLPDSAVMSLYSHVEDKTYLENVDARVQTFTYNLDAIRKYLPPSGRLLDVGSYCGVFLKVARERGYDVTGVEPSIWASAYARDVIGVPTVTGSVADVSPSKPFDVICSWDVLEHLSDPTTELTRINERLRPGGIFAFSTLDYRNWYAQLMGEKWPWLLDMHLYYFDQKVIRQMLEKAGFRLLHTQSYCHIVTAEYMLRKLDALGVPAAGVVRALVQETPLRGVYVPFRFGDIQLFVCEKVSQAAVSHDARLAHEAWAG